MNYIELSDSELVVLLNQDNERAYLELYRRYKVPLTYHLFRVLRASDLVEEQLQEIFLMLWEKRKEIDPNKSISAFLYVSAINRTKNIFRRFFYEKKYKEEFLKSWADYEINEVQNWVDAKEAKQILHSLLSGLPPQQKKVYEMCKLEGYSYKEVSEKLNISETTINSHIRNANKSLKSRIKQFIQFNLLNLIPLSLGFYVFSEIFS